MTKKHLYKIKINHKKHRPCTGKNLCKLVYIYHRRHHHKRSPGKIMSKCFFSTC